MERMNYIVRFHHKSAIELNGWNYYHYKKMNQLKNSYLRTINELCGIILSKTRNESNLSTISRDHGMNHQTKLIFIITVKWIMIYN